MGGGRNQNIFGMTCWHNLSKIPFLPVTVCIWVFSASYVQADISNVMYGIGVKSRPNYTRLLFKLEKEGDFYLTVLPGKRLGVTFPGALPPQWGKHRSYSDSRIGGISIRRRNDKLTVIVSMKGNGDGYRLIAPVQRNLVTLDVGPGINNQAREPVLPGREQICSGTEKLMHEFEPPVRPDVPFIPSDGKLLRKMMPVTDVKLFQRGESAIYKDNPSEAVEIFRQFSDRGSPVRAMAAFRLGEALYLMQKYQDALSVFREGEKLGPEYMVQNPSAIFFYADCLARAGDFERGRKIMVRLIVGLAGTEHAPSLLVRLADMYGRAGREKEAISIYRNVLMNFPRSRAFNSARMRICDDEFFSINSVTCLDLIRRYRAINASASDPVLQDESLFKAVLLESMYRPAGEAVTAVSEYGRKFPYGIFTSVSKAIREDLLVCLFHELKANNDCRGLLNMVEKYRNDLAKCLAEEGFVRFISACYTERGMHRQEMTLFTQLVDSEWAAGSAPYMYSRILEDALILGNRSLAEGAARSFLRKFPGDELAWGVAARLGEICYMNGNMNDTAAVLSRLLEKGGRIEQPESLYYLGKALESLGKRVGSDKAMALFVNELRKRGADSRFRADAFMVMANNRLGARDNKGAMSMYRAGYEAARGDYRDAFLYKMGDLSRQEGNYDAARDFWEKLVKEGSDSLWKKMASDEIADLEWRAKWKFNRK